MTPENNILKAVELKKSGTCNCAQAVACAFCNETGVSHDTMAAITSAFGIGMGTTRTTCGALIGAGVVIGLKERDRTRARMAAKELVDKFEQRNGASICGQLKGLGTGKVLRACNDCVADAAEFTLQYLNR